MAKRQFIWIMTDTTGYDMVGCYGFPHIHTPCLDGMARAGLRFDRAYTAQPVCGPARSALFTGQFPHSNGSWGNSMPLGADVLTLGQRLRAEGIHTAYIGKWHLDAGDYFGNGVCPDGWDAEYWYDMKCYLDELSDEERLASRRFETCEQRGGVPEEETFGGRVTRRALQYIERHRDEDFFLVVSYDEPHDPGLCPAPYARMYQDFVLPSTPAHGDRLEDKPECLQIWGAAGRQLDREALERRAPSLLGCNSFADHLVGQVLDCARACAPDSVRMFTSDHGDAMQAHCLSGKGPAVFDEIARVPLIVEGPGVPAGAVYPHVVSHIDLPATVMDWMGLPRPVLFEGRSLRPQWLGDTSPTGRPAFVEFGRYEIDHDGFGGFQPMRAIITDRHKLALHLLDGDELYDAASDPYDRTNRIGDPAFAAIRDALHDQLLGWMNDTRDPFRGYQWKCRPWRGGAEKSWDVDGYTRQRENEPGEYRQLDYSTGLAMERAVREK